MRRWLLVVLVLLLSVRGWVGDAMAGEMLAQRLAGAATETQAMSGAAPAPRLHLSDGASSDCHGGMSQAHLLDAESSSTDTLAAPAQGDCPTCSACQICSTMGVVLATAPRLPEALAHPAPTARPTVIAFFAPAALFKPPIS